MPNYSPEDINKMFQAMANQEPLSPDFQQRYGLPETPVVSDIQSSITGHLSQFNQPLQGQHPSPYQPSTFQPNTPAPEMMSLEDMMDIVNRRTELATAPRVDALERSLEEMQLSGQRRIGDVSSAYGRAREDMHKDINLMQQQGAQTAERRGIYDSGLAAKLGSQIATRGLEMGMQLGEEQARQLADIAEYLDLQTRHTMEEIQGIMGEKALMAQTMLDELRQEQQARGDMLSQREFENWLSMQAHELNQWRSNMEEYWREQSFDAGRADQEWQQWFNEEQLSHAQEQAEWERVFSMNRWEAEHELQVMLANNQISQQEFQNALSLDEFNLKKRMFQLQQQQAGHSMAINSMVNVPAGSSGSTSGSDWRDAFMTHTVR